MEFPLTCLKSELLSKTEFQRVSSQKYIEKLQDRLTRYSGKLNEFYKATNQQIEKSNNPVDLVETLNKYSFDFLQINDSIITLINDLKYQTLYIQEKQEQLNRNIVLAQSIPPNSFEEKWDKLHFQSFKKNQFADDKQLSEILDKRYNLSQEIKECLDDKKQSQQVVKYKVNIESFVLQRLIRPQFFGQKQKQKLYQVISKYFGHQQSYKRNQNMKNMWCEDHDKALKHKSEINQEFYCQRCIEEINKINQDKKKIGYELIKTNKPNWFLVQPLQLLYESATVEPYSYIYDLKNDEREKLRISFIQEVIEL